MAKDFNVYEWRRNMIQENVGADDLESIKKLPFNQAIKAYYGGSEPTKKEVEIFTDLYFGNPASLNENNPIVKKLKDITWEDVAGLTVPTSMGGRTTMDDRDIFDDEWRQNTLLNWKNKLKLNFPNADEFEVIIDRNNPTWFNKVIINNDEYKNAMVKKDKSQQADYEKYRGRYQGD